MSDHYLSTQDKQSKKRRAAVLAALMAVLCLGAGVIGFGIHGLNDFEASGFSSGDAFTAIRSLSSGVSRDWEKILKPQLAVLSTDEEGAIDQTAHDLLCAAWSDLDSDNGRMNVETVLASRPQKEHRDVLYKLLYMTYLMGKPRVSSAVKKQLPDGPNEAEAFCTAVLRHLADEQSLLPDAAAAAVQKLDGADRQAMLLQLVFTALSSQSSVKNDDVSGLKKGVRDKASQPQAFRMIVMNEVGPFRQFGAANSKTIILIGILIMIDSALMCALMLKDGTWLFDIKWLIILLIVDFLLVFQLLPLVYMLIRAFFPNGSFSFETIKRLYTYPLNKDALINTLIASFATMVLGTLLAFPLAWLVGRTNIYGKRFFRRLFILTYMVPPYVGAMAWMRLLNPNAGSINVFLRSVFSLPDQPGPFNIYSLSGMIWVLTTFYYPYAFITISRAMEKMDPSLEEASRVSGASPLKTLFTVTIPLMLPSIISGALLVFIAAASCYGIPSIIGAPGRVNTITTRIVEYVGLGQDKLEDATALSMFLMLIALIVLLVSDLLLSKRQYITVSGKSVRPAIVDLRKWRIPLTVMVSLFSFIVVLVPFATIFTTSFKADVGKSMFAAGNFTFANWITVYDQIETVNSLKNSLLFAAVAATAGILIACVMSYLLQRTNIRGRKLPDFMIALGSGTPSVVIALGMIMTMKGSFGVNIYNTAYILIIAYMIKYTMMGMRTVTSAMSQIHVSLEESSQVSGASWLHTMLHISAPLIMPSIAAGWFLIFIPSFYELSMTALLYASTTKTIGFQLYEYWTFTSQPQSCAMAFGILMFVILLNFILNRLTKGEFSI